MIYDTKASSLLISSYYELLISLYFYYYMLENNPVGAWLRQNYEMTGNREDCIQKTELYQAFVQDTGISKTQKSFSEDIVKCNINDKKDSKGIRYYFGILRKND